MTSTIIKAITMPKWGLTMKEGLVGDWLIEEGDTIDSGMEVVDVETDKITSAVEVADSGTLRRTVAVPGETLPVGAMLGVIAEAEVSDEELDAFIQEFQENFVPEEADEADSGPKTETAQIGELKINFLRQGSAEKTAVLLHGFGGDLNNWLFNHMALIENRTVLAIDLPGHGSSSKTVGDGGFAFMANTIQQLMKELDVSKADWVGHSMGGAIALQLAQSHPTLVRSLTLIGSAGLGAEINADYLRGFTQSESRRELKPHVQQLFKDPSLVTRQLVDDLLKFKRIDGVQACLQTITDCFIDEGHQVENLRNVLEAQDIPALVIWGAEDQIIPANHASDLPSQDNVHILEDGGHMVQMESATEVNKLITDFWKD
jgi:pyruvate dehydrogenase E2 component (dihydrolipoamide acetyltransferase)